MIVRSYEDEGSCWLIVAVGNKKGDLPYVASAIHANLMIAMLLQKQLTSPLQSETNRRATTNQPRTWCQRGKATTT